MAGSEGKLYVYALTEPGPPQRMRVLGRSLHIITVGEVGVVVERRRGQVEPTSEVLQEQHAVVMQLAEKRGALLPARFGSVVEETTLRATVAEQRAEIVHALGLVRGRQQMTVRVFGVPDAARPVANRTSTGTAFLEARRDRAHYVPAEVATIRAVMGQFTVAERVEPGERRLRVTVFHLVPRGVVDAYRQQASALQSMLVPHEVTVTGPWPAFAFAPDLF
jgi:hypothetical protein